MPMPMRLDLDALQVESFEPVVPRPPTSPLAAVGFSGEPTCIGWLTCGACSETDGVHVCKTPGCAM